jgi:helicase required for RNAi-mediated heterochromatin assembly 1
LDHSYTGKRTDLRRFSLANRLVDLDNDVQPPKFLEEHPYLNLNALVRTELDPETGVEMPALNDPSLNNVNVLENFPHIPNSGMDDSQMKACKRMLTSELAIIQGPPGTGKTFTSVSAIKTIVDNIDPNEEPPIIIAAQTNHALDQLITHVMGFEKNVVRLGGRTAKENTEIKKRTLYELRIDNPIPGTGSGLKRCKASRDRKIEEMQQVLAPLLTSELLTHEVLLNYGVITEEQGQSLFEDGWENTERIGNSIASGVSACKSSQFRRRKACI